LTSTALWPLPGLLHLEAYQNPGAIRPSHTLISRGSPGRALIRGTPTARLVLSLPGAG